jgi:hypothetical protein
LWKSFRTHRENDSGLLQTPFTFSPESPFIFNPGTLFAFAPERFSRSSRNRVHLAPESAALEEDLHVHIHLENKILFPRAIALEKL